ncbi:ferritin-like domain-containing protein [Calorimonas adulescens]|jgi:Rubrerythrin.|uniref:Ferritin family protein n=1 Tax=Calorimonas adulescens TaxID=2606906 RepID=A0A5D8QF66_9THEO|nr:ferritin family protein [Calorimonas adulescens]TZE83215.1 ferritin family protein [Calorimonas adulescens]
MEKELNVIKFAMSMELEGESFYSNYSKSVKNPGAKDLFEQLTKMEEAHYKYLKAQYDNLSNGKQVDKPVSDFESPELFNKRMEQQGTASSSFETSTSDITLLRMAYLIENDFMDFYKKAAENVDDAGVKNLFLSLAEWEKGHREALEKQYKEIFESNWYNMGFYPF